MINIKNSNNTGNNNGSSNNNDNNNNNNNNNNNGNTIWRILDAITLLQLYITKNGKLKKTENTVTLKQKL